MIGPHTRPCNLNFFLEHKMKQKLLAEEVNVAFFVHCFAVPFFTLLLAAIGSQQIVKAN